MADDDAQQKLFHLLDVLAIEVSATRVGVERVEAVATQTRHGLDRVERRLGYVETRLEHVETRLEHVETRLEHVEVRLEHVETRLEHIEGDVGAMRGVSDRVSALESRIE